jgi:hypothetical protein
LGHWLVSASQKEQHVADLLLFVLPAKSLTINICCRVADFLDLCINLSSDSSRQFYVFALMFLPFPFQMVQFIQLLTRQRTTKSSNMLLVCSLSCYRLSR